MHWLERRQLPAVIGKREVMEAAQKTFISSTFWTDRVGPTAALKTLEIMEREKSWEFITKQGIYLQKEWETIANKNNLKIKLGNFPALANFNIESSNWLKYKTFISQELLKVGFLAANACYLSIYHDDSILNNYLLELDKVFEIISKAKNEEINIEDYIEGEICHDNFRRLT